MHPKLTKKQQGFSLIEMLIALLIGLFLLGGVVSVYIGSSQSSQLNSGLIRIQENARHSLMVLNKLIQKAGYSSNYDPSKSIKPFDRTNNFTNETQIIVNHEADLDCANHTVSSGLAVSRIILRDGSIGCIGNAGDGHLSWKTNWISEGVDAMQLLYGLDDDDDGLADRYVTDATVDATPDGWDEKVSSIRVGLLLNSITPVKKSDESKSYSVLDTTVGPFNDRLLRKVFTTTILIRNQRS